MPEDVLGEPEGVLFWKVHAPVLYDGLKLPDGCVYHPDHRLRLTQYLPALGLREPAYTVQPSPVLRQQLYKVSDTHGPRLYRPETFR